MTDQSKALATPDAALIELWKSTKTGEDATGNNKIPIMKIVQPVSSALEPCKHSLGSWVIGLKRNEEGQVEDHGKLIKGFVILAVRNRYSYYDINNTNTNCSTQLFGDDFREAVGNKHKYNCIDKTCPYRMKDGNPKCRAQKVVFGVAITDEGEFIDCQTYVQGSSYMPFSTYVTNMKQVKTQGGYAEAPTYAFLTLLGSERKVNGQVVYYEGVFKRGPMFSPDKYKMFHEKHLDVVALIKASNQTSPANGNGAPTGQTTQGNTRNGGSQVQNAPPVNGGVRPADDAIDIPGMQDAFVPDDDIPFDLGAGSTSGASAEPVPEDFDIEAAIQNALKS